VDRTASCTANGSCTAGTGMDDDRPELSDLFSLFTVPGWKAIATGCLQDSTETVLAEYPFAEVVDRHATAWSPVSVFFAQRRSWRSGAHFLLHLRPIRIGTTSRVADGVAKKGQIVDR
jgi:hypothetical protein